MYDTIVIFNVGMNSQTNPGEDFDRASGPLELLTVTWRGDFSAFRLLRASLEQSDLRGLQHHIVVHTEDRELFQSLPLTNATLHTTAEVLPGDLEARRVDALQKQQKWGRHWVRRFTSLRRYGGPGWVRYIGWHMQQISKLAWVAARPSGTVAVIDSDVVVTPHARSGHLLAGERPLCFTQPVSFDDLRGKVRKWNQTSAKLFPSSQFRPDKYFDTPFVFDVPSVKAMLADMELRYRKPWHTTLLDLPPRRWSEFATYRAYLQASGQPVNWQHPDRNRYAYDASSLDVVRSSLSDAWADTHCDFLTIHSQSSGKQLWSIADYVDDLEQWIRAQPNPTGLA